METSVRTSNRNQWTKMHLSQKNFFKSPLIFCRNLQMFEFCSLQFSHSISVVQSHCCQLILHIKVNYAQLKFRHDDPFNKDWLCPRLLDTRNKENTLREGNCHCRCGRSKLHKENCWGIVNINWFTSNKLQAEEAE